MGICKSYVCTFNSCRIELQAKADCESRVQKAKMDEAALLRAMQDLRVKTMDDEKELSAVCDHIKVGTTRLSPHGINVSLGTNLRGL